PGMAAVAGEKSETPAAADHARAGHDLAAARRRAALEAAAVGLVADDAEHDLAEALDRLRAGLAIGLGDALALVLGELPLELDTFVGELEQALAPVAAAGPLHDEALAHQLAEHAAQALLGDAQDDQEGGHAHQ